MSYGKGMSLPQTRTIDDRLAELEGACQLVGSFMTAAAAYDRRLLSMIQEMQNVAQNVSRLQGSGPPFMVRSPAPLPLALPGAEGQ
jgi:hypothetical protein